jgi:hypothetical protein
MPWRSGSAARMPGFMPWPPRFVHGAAHHLGGRRAQCDTAAWPARRLAAARCWVAPAGHELSPASPLSAVEQGKRGNPQVSSGWPAGARARDVTTQSRRRRGKNGWLQPRHWGILSGRRRGRHPLAATSPSVSPVRARRGIPVANHPTTGLVGSGAALGVRAVSPRLSHRARTRRSTRARLLAREEKGGEERRVRLTRGPQLSARGEKKGRGHWLVGWPTRLACWASWAGGSLREGVTPQVFGRVN